ncbi:MAG TPA: cytochrome c oxidase assembly protein, partial [Vicinamibacterales bacterium]|nr:cytochrome c oxidase assembly protein [Vicinamibacterales bacterium]
MSEAPAAGRRRHWARLAGGAVAMFGFGYALVPLYGLVCDLTGFSGSTSMLVNPAEARERPDASRLVTVEFTTTVNGSGPWTFAAQTQKLQVHPGQLYTVNFIAKNGREQAVVAQATPNILPRTATKYLKKTECFCFRQQPFAAGEEKTMPVRFMLDPE